MSRCARWTAGGGCPHTTLLSGLPALLSGAMFSPQPFAACCHLSGHRIMRIACKGNPRGQVLRTSRREERQRLSNPQPQGSAAELAMVMGLKSGDQGAMAELYDR